MLVSKSDIIFNIEILKWRWKWSELCIITLVIRSSRQGRTGWLCVMPAAYIIAHHALTQELNVVNKQMKRYLRTARYSLLAHHASSFSPPYLLAKASCLMYAYHRWTRRIQHHKSGNLWRNQGSKTLCSLICKKQSGAVFFGETTEVQ